MVHACNASVIQQNIKFGVEVPRSTTHALKRDERDGTNLWKEAMNTENKQLHQYETFKVLRKDEKVPEG